MKTFESFVGLADHLAVLATTLETSMHPGLVKAAAAGEEKAKGEFGTYQPEVGPYPAWAELADATQDERVRQGFTPNDPLLRTGELRDSIAKEVGAREAVIGSTSPVIVWHEFGTSRMPPRPVLGPALLQSEAQIKEALAGALFTAIVPNHFFPKP